jgi:hypothetical protein
VGKGVALDKVGWRYVAVMLCKSDTFAQHK